MRKISSEPCQLVTLYIPSNWVREFVKMADEKNPWRAIMRDALKQYLGKPGKPPTDEQGQLMEVMDVLKEIYACAYRGGIFNLLPYAHRILEKLHGKD